MVTCSNKGLRRIRSTTIASVGLIALIAAVVSYRHMHELCMRHGEDRLAAVLIPLAVDGLIVVASMTILLSSRYGSRGSPLAWTLLVAGSLASLGANVAVAEPGLIGRIIAAWPSAALIGSYELLMTQIRRPYPASMTVTAGERSLSPMEASSPPCGVEGHTHAELRQAAWQWALANRLPDGTLPSGRAIAVRFRRSPRWGRWIKRAGLEGRFG
ncbi:DUF2637 domain-containing protein [Spongiactinospora sp. TRM90649]|uniref:DUF2637 domain-containing protein n=1 Tax=Spongiactinospora sp. TRM90649 TaxID=3031114 RepID=UPI0023F6F15B|nr:DUF2637 domain-containing protein [Spongiactinospora sp. TRM90649]MDF5758374.1 DUF2637 domain-containing protein [Spongiactinospora sp. TRM90649]